MRHPRRAARLLVAGALIISVGTASLQPAAAHGAASTGLRSTARRHAVIRHKRTQPVFSYKNATRETVYVQSSIDGDGDGRLDLLATDIIRPKPSGNGMKVPVIYEMSPYYTSLGRGNESETKNPEDGDFVPDKFPLFYDNYFVPRGYAFIAQDMRGTRNSEGCMVLGGHEEVLDAVATINWLNGKGKAFTGDGKPVRATWSSGKVGMIGKSYDASITNGAASTGVPGLKTIVPISGISRWYDYHLNNGVQYENAYVTPADFVFITDETPASDQARKEQWVESTFTKNSTCQAIGTQVIADAGDPRADYTPFWDDRDYLKDAGNVRASVLLSHGLNDFNVKPNQYWQWWRALSRYGVKRKIWLSQTGHVDPFDYRRVHWVHTLHQWFDRWLYGVHNGVMAQPMADVERTPHHWVTYKTWPAAGARMTPLYFGPQRKKVPGTLASRRSTTTRRAAAQSYGDADGGDTEQAMTTNEFQAETFRLLYLSPKIKHRFRISGTSRVSIKAAVDKPDTNFTALLVDYGMDRRVDHDSAGEGVRTLQTQSCWGKSTKADDACYFNVQQVMHKNPIEIVSRGWLDARHHTTLRANTPLTPGQIYRFKWDIFSEDYIFKPGHRLGIVIAGSDSDWTIPDPSQANVTVYLRSSKVMLPVVGGKKVLGF
ncbi:MAG: X-Pro dipeptidyl-peptidase [Actinomycetota bacterium]|nr:X-Pro dipeptidyl-peptidase [Actinomycetota bacterium]